MAQSQNSTVDLATPATCLMGLTSHGNVMVGNKAFEYYNERNPEDYIQIPWDEVDYIAAEVLRGTKKITRFAIFTKDNGHFTFSTRDDKETLRAVRKYVDEDKLVRSPDFIDVTAKGAKSISIVTLLDKPARREKAVEADLAGFVVPDEFVVGYGLDYAQMYRNLPYIGVLKPAVYEHT